MGYEKINPITEFNFQANRVLAYGESACDRFAWDRREVEAAVRGIRTFTDWHNAWLTLARRAEGENRCLYAAYCYRMVEFFLTSDNPEKEEMYERCIRNFDRGFDQELHLCYERQDVPFGEAALNCIRIPAENARGTVLVCGGYDSFIEEFVIQVAEIAQRGYTAILFEGPGQGRCLRENRHGYSGLTNSLAGFMRRRSILADWALSQGMYITGTKTIYDFYKSLSRHCLSGITDRLTGDILLLNRRETAGRRGDSGWNWWGILSE